MASDRPRPRLSNTLSTNHGGVAVVSAPGLLHSVVVNPSEPLTFESVCLRFSSYASSFVLLLIYRTGPLTTAFFDELSDVLDFLATLSVPLIVADDLNIHVERSQDPHSRLLLDTCSSHGLASSVFYSHRPLRPLALDLVASCAQTSTSLHHNYIQAGRNST